MSPPPQFISFHVCMSFHIHELSYDTFCMVSTSGILYISFHYGNVLNSIALSEINVIYKNHDVISIHIFVLFELLFYA